MILYHRTLAAVAEKVLREGFRDGSGTYMTTRLHTGVWLSDVPLDINEGAEGDTVLSVTIDGRSIRKFEWIEDKGYREWLIPAILINGHSAVRVMHKDEVERIERTRWRRLRVEAMRRHIMQLLDEHGIAHEWCRRQSNAWTATEYQEVRIAPIRSVISYSTALHERVGMRPG